MVYWKMKGTPMETLFDHDAEQIVITPELLALLRHIVDNHPDELKTFIAQVKRTQRGRSAADGDDLQQAQSSIVEFLSLMEALAYQVNRQNEADHQMHHHLR